MMYKVNDTDIILYLKYSIQDFINTKLTDKIIVEKLCGLYNMNNKEDLEIKLAQQGITIEQFKESNELTVLCIEDYYNYNPQLNKKTITEMKQEIAEAENKNSFEEVIGMTEEEFIEKKPEMIKIMGSFENCIRFMYLDIVMSSMPTTIITLPDELIEENIEINYFNKYEYSVTKSGEYSFTIKYSGGDTKVLKIPVELKEKSTFILRDGITNELVGEFEFKPGQTWKEMVGQYLGDRLITETDYEGFYIGEQFLKSGGKVASKINEKIKSTTYFLFDPS